MPPHDHSTDGIDPNLRPSKMGKVNGFSLRDLPAGCDLNIMPKGDPRTQVKDKIYVVWEGYEIGLFWSWYVFRHV